MASTTFDPYTWRIAELAMPVDAQRRARLLDGLLIAEAEELAHGRRHLTVVHGLPESTEAAEVLDDFYDAILDIADAADWSRVQRTPQWLTIAVAGAWRDDVLTAIEVLATEADVQIIDAPFPS
jgi:hypothetical protein